MIAAIDSERAQGNLSSAIRLFVLETYRAQIGVETDGRPSSHSAVERNGGERLTFAG
jgi:predicted DNA-binding ribbon-helix-helix protein